jgi:hypothetical protein
VIGLVVVAIAVVGTLLVGVRTGLFGYSVAIVAASVSDTNCCDH